MSVGAESRGRHILDLMSGAPTGECRVQFVTPRGVRETTFADLWLLSGRAARAVKKLPAGRVAGILTPSPEMVAFFVGCLRAGRDFVSLPLPGRGQEADAYQAQLRLIAELSEASVVTVEAAYADLLRAVGAPSVPIAVVEGLLEAVGEATVGSPGDPEPGDLIQFSSGTTGAPKGVRLAGTALGASVEATLDALGVGGAPEVFCAWVPLSHDMGLVGGLLGSWVGNTRTRPGYRYICISPELFIARPLLWLETCSANRATFTAGPTFAYGVLARHLARGPTLDLSSLRAALVGAEPIGPHTLQSFAAGAFPHGFREMALCPAYGLAEAALVVSVVRPGEGWSSRTVSMDGRPGTYVSCGRTLDCVRVTAPDVDTGPGPIRVGGAAICREILSSTLSRPGEWLDTGDLGVLAEGELLVTGRADDLLCVGGRNVFAWELERAAATLSGIRSGDCAVVTDGRGRYAVLFEARHSPDDELGPLLREVRRRLVSEAGIGPSAVGCLPRGTLPKTPSGKIRRNRIAADLGHLSRTCLAFEEF